MLRFKETNLLTAMSLLSSGTRIQPQGSKSKFWVFFTSLPIIPGLCKDQNQNSEAKNLNKKFDRSMPGYTRLLGDGLSGWPHILAGNFRHESEVSYGSMTKGRRQTLAVPITAQGWDSSCLQIPGVVVLLPEPSIFGDG